MNTPTSSFNLHNYFPWCLFHWNVPTPWMNNSCTPPPCHHPNMPRADFKKKKKSDKNNCRTHWKDFMYHREDAVGWRTVKNSSHKIHDNATEFTNPESGENVYISASATTIAWYIEGIVIKVQSTVKIVPWRENHWWWQWWLPFCLI